MKCVQSANEYFEDLMKEIDKAQKSVLLQSMLFEYGEKIERLEKHLIKASRRGVGVKVHYDWVSEKYIHGELQKIPTIDRKKRNFMDSLQKKNQKMHKRLEEAGVELNVTNDPSFPTKHMPYLGRSHIKMSVIDTKLSWVGGVNLFDGAFENIDIMVKSTKVNLAEALSIQFYRINENKNSDDYRVRIDEVETLYVDTGSKGKSIIYDTAKERIRDTRSNIIFMSQFVPDSKLLNEIEQASERGISVTILTSPTDNPNFTKYPEKLTYVMLMNSIQERKNIKLIHLARNVHAKLLIVDNEIALYGSHNYTYSGVLFGTEEIMLETTEKEVIDELKLFIKENMNS